MASGSASVARMKLRICSDETDTRARLIPDLWRGDLSIPRMAWPAMGGRAMIQAAFFSVFDYIAKNRWIQIVLSIGVVIFLDHLRIRHIRASERRKEQARNVVAARKVQTQIRKTLDEKSISAKQAGDSVIPGSITHSDKLPDSIRRRFIIDGDGE